MPANSPVPRLRGATLAALAALSLPEAASARYLWLDWPHVASASSDTCHIEVVGPGHVFVLTVEGLEPSENGQLVVVNGDQKFAWRMVADEDGMWKTAYLPYRFDRGSGIVMLNVQTPSCFLSVSFPWTRRSDWLHD